VTVALLDHRQAVHAMAMGREPDGNAIDRLYALNGVQSLLRRAGETSEALLGRASDLLYRHLTQEVMVAAFQDCFLLTAVVFILAMVPALFVRPPPRPVWRKWE
jgi:hypothetical protein